MFWAILRPETLAIRLLIKKNVYIKKIIALIAKKSIKNINPKESYAQMKMLAYANFPSF